MHGGLQTDLLNAIREDQHQALEISTSTPLLSRMSRGIAAGAVDVVDAIERQALGLNEGMTENWRNEGM